ncbi:hypothetical protein ACWDR2_40100 [Streptomyces sp. NPDC003631]
MSPTEHAHARPSVTDVRTVAAFDFSTGNAPENITVNPDGPVTLSMLGALPARRTPPTSDHEQYEPDVHGYLIPSD